MAGSAKKTSRRRKMRLKGHYGIDSPGDVAMLFLKASMFSFASLVFSVFYGSLVRILSTSIWYLPKQFIGFAIGFAIMFSVLMAFGMWFTIIHMLYTSLVVKYRVTAKMVHIVKNWEKVQSVLDVGCGRGLLLNMVALRLLKERAGGSAVGVDVWTSEDERAHNTIAQTLRNARLEGVNQIVTCKTGDARCLPFDDNCFDVVMSALHLSALGAEVEGGQVAAAQSRRQALHDMVRVLRPRGEIVLWDIAHGKEYALELEKMGMEEIWTSEPISAFMLPSHIVYGKCPKDKSKLVLISSQEQGSLEPDLVD